MSLIKCPECGKEISDKAVSCPNCGNPIAKQEEEYLCCPKCGSRELHAEHQGFSGGKALAGVAITGGIGLLAGTIGSSNTKITCLKCGNTFKAGQARVVSNKQPASKEDAEAIEAVKKLGAIGAVKWYKDLHGCNLSVAKSYIDSIREKYCLPASREGSSSQGCMVAVLVAIISSLSTLLLL